PPARLAGLEQSEPLGLEADVFGLVMEDLLGEALQKWGAGQLSQSGEVSLGSYLGSEEQPDAAAQGTVLPDRAEQVVQPARLPSGHTGGIQETTHVVTVPLLLLDKQFESIDVGPVAGPPCVGLGLGKKVGAGDALAELETGQRGGHQRPLGV